MRKPPLTAPLRSLGRLPTTGPRKSPGMPPRCRGRDPARKKLSHRCPRVKCGLFSSIRVCLGSSLAVRYKQGDRSGPAAKLAPHRPGRNHGACASGLTRKSCSALRESSRKGSSMSSSIITRHVVLGAATLFVAFITLADARSQEKVAAPKWDFKAVAFSSDEKESIKKLNALAREGWEYVGPLGNALVAFKRRIRS